MKKPCHPCHNMSEIGNNTLLSLYDKVNKQKKLTNLIQSLLPEQIKHFALHCLIKNDHLIIFTDSPAKASQLRFKSSKLIEKLLETSNLSVKSIQIKTLLPLNNQIPNNRSLPNTPKPETIEEIRKNLDAYQDLELRTAMTKLCTILSKQQKKLL